MSMKALQIQFKKTRELLDISCESLCHSMHSDVSFPNSIKIGAAKQAPVYFDYAEFMQSYESQKNKLAEQEVLG
ncbi:MULTISPECIES: hypothetical protein [Acinetobacter]|uniref:hypothetical protein n=1 Tax=Acinetobacter TaxID=469 RepID=UPI000585375F|nr:hypothetical protein [Acinetobacter pittii]KIE87153.1 transcriptional regulator [Acinetobacter pittii]